MAKRKYDFWPKGDLPFGQKSYFLWPKVTIRVFPCIPVYSRVFPLYSAYSRVFPCIPCIPGYPGIPVYSRVFPVIRVFPCIPVYSRVFLNPVYSRVFPCIPVFPCHGAPREALEPRGPFREARGDRRPCSVDGVGRVVGYPLDMPIGHVQGGTPPPYPTPSTEHVRRAPRAARERASGLKWPRGLRVAGCARPQVAGLFPYLRSFWPGIQNPLQRVLGNRWIGSRSRPAGAGLDVSDLECLSWRCGTAGSVDGGDGSGG